LRRLVRGRALAVTLVFACCGLLGCAATSGSRAATESTAEVLRAPASCSGEARGSGLVGGCFHAPASSEAYGARASTRTGVVHLHQFRSPSGNILCSLGDEDRAYCLTWYPPRSVSVDFRGKLRTCTGSRNCTGPCVPGSHLSGCVYGKVPVLAYGQQDEYSLYSCVSRTTGVTCTVARGAATGKGFRIAKAGITRVAQPKPSPVTAEFYSVPGWHCLMFSSGVSCENVTRGWEADLSPSGGVTICTAGTDACHTGAHTGQGIPTIKVGQQVTVQPFRCTYTTNGLTCVVIKTGVGFLLTTSGASKVG
jgi:hypothetical protein